MWSPQHDRIDTSEFPFYLHRTVLAAPGAIHMHAHTGTLACAQSQKSCHIQYLYYKVFELRITVKKTQLVSL